jgi:hypothetical protein
MTEQELDELKFSKGEFGLHASKANCPALRIEKWATEVRQAPEPEFEPFLVAVHLALDDLQVGFRRPLRHRRQLAQIMPHPIENASLEVKQIGIDAQPMSSVFPM